MCDTARLRAGGADAIRRRRLRSPIAVLAGIAAIAVAPVLARDQRTVFHGMPTEPESGIVPGKSVRPVALSRVWLFDDFRAPLAGDPAPGGDRLVASDRSGDIAALGAADGRVLWRTHLGEALEVGPTLAGGAVLQGTASGNLVALDAGDGRVLWRASLGDPPLAAPLAAPGRLLVTTAAPALLALDPADGAVLARRPLPGRPVPPALGGGAVLVGTDHGMVLALDPSTLEVRWRRYLRRAITAPPLVVRKHVYVAVADRSLRCLHLGSGRQAWRQRLGSIATARMIASDDFLYMLSWDDDIYVVRRRNGHLAARVRLDHRLTLDAARGADYLFVAPFTEGSVLALSLPALGMAGKFDLNAPGEWFTTSPVLLEERVAVGSGREEGRVLGLEVKPAPPPEEPARGAARPATGAAPPAPAAPGPGG